MGKNYVGFHKEESSIAQIAKEYIITMLMIVAVLAIILCDASHNIKNSTKQVPMPYAEFKSSVVIGL